MGGRSRSVPPLVLVDANAIIEAVRTGCWAAITGGLTVETVQECLREVESGSPLTIPGYVRVSRAQLQRLTAVRAVEDAVRASLKLAYPDADGMDRGEQDLLALAYEIRGEPWALCSPDKASVRAAVALGLEDRIWSLEHLASAVGSRPNPPLRKHFTEGWLVSFRTQVRLEGP